MMSELHKYLKYTLGTKLVINADLTPLKALLGTSRLSKLLECFLRQTLRI